MEPQAESARPIPLSSLEQRVVGCLIEKAMTTPEAYPMTVNGLVTAANQKSNRDPLMTLQDYEVEDGLRTLQAKGLVGIIQGGRVDRWRHYLYEVWKVSRVELAVMAELFLRGAQTEGELRGRVDRMASIGSIDELRERIGPLREREFVAYLSPERSRGATLDHRFRADAPPIAQGGAVVVPVAERPAEPAPSELAALRAEVAELRAAGERTAGEVSSLRGQLADLRKALGVEG